MVDEEELLSTNLSSAHKGAIMGDHGLEFAPERLAHHPVNHEATEGGTGSNAILNINVVEIVAHVFPAFNNVFIGSTAPVILNIIDVFLAKPSATSWVRGDNDIALVSPNTGIPSCAPCVSPGRLGAPMWEQSKRVCLILAESSWLYDPSMVL